MSRFKVFLVTFIFGVNLFCAIENASAATCSWIGCDGNWSNPSNWDCGMVPSAIDDVIISVFNCEITLDQEVTIASLELTEATLTGTHHLTINGNLTFDEATVSTSGNVIINNGIVDIIGSGTIGNLFLNGVTINQDASLILNGGQMDNASIWEANADLFIGGQFSNLGTFNYHTTEGMSGFANFNNQGTFNQTAPGIIIPFTPIITMGGIWNIDGYLYMDNLAILFGDINLSDGAILNLTTANILGGASINFSGSAKVTKGNGVVNINTDFVLDGTMEFRGGEIAGSGSLEIASGASFDIVSEAMSLNLPVTVAAGGEMNIFGFAEFPIQRSLSGPITNNGTINHLGMVVLTSDDITNNSDWNWTHGTLSLNNNTAFNNTGTLTVSQDATVAANTGCNSLFWNDTDGTLIKSAGSGDLAFETDFINDGQLTINSGNVRFDCPYILQGNITSNLGTAIIVSDGSTGAGVTIASGTSLQIQGGGTFIVNHPLAIDGTLDLSDGFVTGSGSIAVNGIMNWLNGDLLVNTTIAGGGNLNLLGPDDKFLLGTLNLNGTTTHTDGALIVFPGIVINNSGDYIWQSGDIDLGISATFNNNGNFRMQTAGAFSGSMMGAGLFNNAGLYENNLIVPAPGFGFDPDFNNTGTFRQTTNQLLPFFGAFNNQGSGLIGGLGLLDFSGGFTNNGTVSPGLSPGELVLTSFDNTNATLNIEIEDVSGSGAGHDHLVVFSPVTLGGTLNVSHTGDPLPANSSFTIINAFGGFGSTQFSTINFPAPASDWSIAYLPTDVVITYQAQPLPVELTFFDAKKQRDHILLQWQTATEINNQGFDIQSSLDGKRWQSIGFVKGQGSSTVLHDYHYEDAAPYAGLNYYRLRQVDFDGQDAYSEVKAVEWVADKEISVYPNPLVNDKLSINFEGHIETLRLLNTQGQLIRKQDIGHFVDRGYEWNLPGLPAGVYWVEVKSDRQHSMIKLIKK